MKQVYQYVNVLIEVYKYAHVKVRM